MAIVNLAPLIKSVFWDSNGNPLSSGKVFTYLAGTSTSATTYSDYEGSILNANPIILDARGQANIFLDTNISYKIVVKDSADAVQYQQDYVRVPLARHVSEAPVSSASSGQTGDYFANDSYLFVYGATGWRRVALSTF